MSGQSGKEMKVYAASASKTNNSTFFSVSTVMWSLSSLKLTLKVLFNVHSWRFATLLILMFRHDERKSSLLYSDFF